MPIGVEEVQEEATMSHRRKSTIQQLELLAKEV